MQHDFILLDRSGSMESMWKEAIASVNGYVKKLAEQNVDTGVTLATFDRDGSEFKFEIVRDRITSSTWRDVAENECAPRGMTPLSDAVGRVVNLAEAGNYDKVAIIVMTDGHENSSRELSVAQAKRRLDDCRAKNWQVIFLGADFDNAAQAASYGNFVGSSIKSSKHNLVGAMAETAVLRSGYATCDSAMSFTDEQKDRLAE